MLYTNILARSLSATFGADSHQLGAITSTVNADVAGLQSLNKVWYQSILSPMTGASVTVAANRIYFIPIYIGHRTAVRGLRVASAATATTGNVILGIYSNNGGLPGSRLVQTSATAVTAGSGFTEIGINYTPPQPGWYWLAAIYSSTPAQTPLDNGNAYLALQGTFNIQAAGRPIHGAIQDAGSFALPATAAALLSERNLIPLIGMSYTP